MKPGTQQPRIKRRNLHSKYDWNSFHVGAVMTLVEKDIEYTRRKIYAAFRAWRLRYPERAEAKIRTQKLSNGSLLVERIA